VANRTAFLPNSYTEYLLSPLTYYDACTRFDIIGVFVGLFALTDINNYSNDWYASVAMSLADGIDLLFLAS